MEFLDLFSHPLVNQMSENYNCLVCSARANGIHFQAQSCGACAAFFRRTITLRRSFSCKSGLENCEIHYTYLNCQACRLRKCYSVGMDGNCVRPKKTKGLQHRLFCTNSGLLRNNVFGKRLKCLETNNSQQIAFRQSDHSELCAGKQLKNLPTLSDGRNNNISTTTYVNVNNDVLEMLIIEELKLCERRRLLFCEKPVKNLLGRYRKCPYTSEEIRPLCFDDFRQTIRTQILLVYEWLNAWPAYEKLKDGDRITLLRKCVLFHTILDPSYITVQIGYPDKFVMQTGGYLSINEQDNDGWEDENGISGALKQRIYRPLLRILVSHLITPMVSMGISFEEFVALKAFVSWHTAVCEVSDDSRYLVQNILDCLCTSLHRYYTINNLDVAERLGNIILLLPAVYAIGSEFVESHHEITFFNLWELDNLLIQLLKCEQ